MIDLRQLDETIDQLQREGSSISQAEKLALLYIAREYMARDGAQIAPTISASSYAAASRNENNFDIAPGVPEDASEFMRTCSGMEIVDILDVMDQHMEAIRALYPREHTRIIRMLEERKYRS